jgi:NADH-quinone oxidoreductase subunit F
LIGIELVSNELGDIDASGRRKPVTVFGTEHTVPLDTLVVAISEGSDIDCVSVASSMQIETTKWDTVRVDLETLCTNQSGVFAGGDVVRGPNTVVDAIADGKKAAVMIDRYLRDEELQQTIEIRQPQIYVEPPHVSEPGPVPPQRVETPCALVEWRKRGFVEVEMSLTAEEAQREARRCLRCDLEFTEPIENEKESLVKEGKTV